MKYLPIKVASNGHLFIDAAQNNIFRTPPLSTQNSNHEMQVIWQSIRNMNSEIEQIKKNSLYPYNSGRMDIRHN